MGHNACYLVANGNDGNTYYTYCKKYSDPCETAFKAQIKTTTGSPCRSVTRKQSAPTNGINLACC